MQDCTVSQGRGRSEGGSGGGGYHDCVEGDHAISEACLIDTDLVELACTGGFGFDEPGTLVLQLSVTRGRGRGSEVESAIEAGRMRRGG